jgi:hypothetical protein
MVEMNRILQDRQLTIACSALDRDSLRELIVKVDSRQGAYGLQVAIVRRPRAPLVFIDAFALRP